MSSAGSRPGSPDSRALAALEQVGIATTGLRSKGIDTVILGGFLTNCCVESTMRSAYENGYRVITLTDCLAATSQAEHDNAIAFDYPMFSHPLSSGEVAAAL